MSGSYGVGYHIPTGINIHSSTYNATDFAVQLQQLPDISYVIVNLSNGAAGDRYIAPHPIFKEKLGMRAYSPKNIDIFQYHAGNPESRTLDLDAFDDLDLFDSILTEMSKIGVKVIAYMNMNAEGPAKLKHLEQKAFDYSAGGDWNNGGYFVNSAVECVPFTGTEPCSPSVRKWVDWVATNYTNEEHNIYPIGDGYDFDDAYVTDSSLQTALKDAYANVVVDYYAEFYGDRISGYWFDAGGFGDRSKIIQALRRHNPNATIAYNEGKKIPLRNNNPVEYGEDFTFGHITPHQSVTNPPDGCYNYGMVLSAENSVNGHVYQDADRINGAAFSSTDLASTLTNTNPYVQPGFNISYKQDDYPSLAHIFMPSRSMWNNGDLVWNPRQVAEWTQRTAASGGACFPPDSTATIDPADFAFLQEAYNLLPITDDYQFDATNCDCQSQFLAPTDALSWGCEALGVDSDWVYIHPNGKPKDCARVCKGASSRCYDPEIKSEDGIPASEACTTCC